MQLAWGRYVNDLAYCIPVLPAQDTGPDLFEDVSTEEPVAFSCHALDLPFIDT